MIPITRNNVSGRQSQSFRQQLKTNEADMVKLQRKIHCLNIQIAFLAIEIKLRDCKATAQAVLRNVVSAVRQGSSCHVHDRRAHSPLEEATLLHESTHPARWYATPENNLNDMKRSKLAQLARKQDHYTAMLIRMEEEGCVVRNELSRYRATSYHPKTTPSLADRAGSELLQSSIRNCMGPSEILELYEDEMEKSKGIEGSGNRRIACTYDNPNFGADDLKDDTLKLALAEGHDADIPSNSGVYHDSPSKEAQTDSKEAETTTSSTNEIEQDDPNIVDWEKPVDQDPANPLNWKDNKKWMNIAIVSLLTLITPLASSMFAPGVPQVLRDFHSTSQTLATFVVSVYLLGFAFGPLAVAPLCEIYGRLPVYFSCSALFVVFSIACAVSSSLNMLIGFRFLMGCVGVAPLTIGAGTIADIMPVERRGRAMAIYSIGPLVGPVIGPVGGGYMVEAVGWRWVYWLLAIISGIAAALAFFVMKESYAPVLLAKKTAKLRKETGNESLRSKLDTGITRNQLIRLALIRPMKMLIFSPIVMPLTIYTGFVYGILYFLFTTYSFVFTERYGFSLGQVGLVYIPIGIGMLFGISYLGHFSDAHIEKRQALGAVVPEDRIPPHLVLPGSIAFAAGIFIYGWTVQFEVHWIAPMIGQAIVGFGMISIFTTVQSYLVDAFTIYAASAMAANTIVRSLFGGVLPLSGLKMYEALGYGWGNSLLGFIALAMVPVMVFYEKKGKWLRESPRFKMNL
ncbi:hypothetical protein FKW77_007382 [Venturia effusa]|uniref:Major facilitator superfamily (MFS) profile domain-containing protein n=1 Tax=Venturia effusa TaxID=50376 RepID=A0A517LB71_9PEZI|nr:hypothetical protein FKW77_007382 [Venturia effusa]